jgi:ribosomal protein L11 methyltransferase
VGVRVRTDGLWIVPEWAEAPDASALNVTLEPGLAFGTGEHATTRLCLRRLAQLQLQVSQRIITGKGASDNKTGSMENSLLDS